LSAFPVSCQVSVFSCLQLVVRLPLSASSCLSSTVSNLLSAFPVSCQVSVFSCLQLVVRLPLSASSCLSSPVSNLLSVFSCPLPVVSLLPSPVSHQSFLSLHTGITHLLSLASCQNSGLKYHILYHFSTLVPLQ
jgi:hypothetical protein